MVGLTLVERSTLDAAHADPLNHGIVGGEVYRFAENESPSLGAYNWPPVLPPDGSDAHESIHVLIYPHGELHRETFLWLADHRAWAPVIAALLPRLAYTPEHLGSRGWRYDRPSDLPEES